MMPADWSCLPSTTLSIGESNRRHPKILNHVFLATEIFAYQIFKNLLTSDGVFELVSVGTLDCMLISG
jgi:hypothetical protein